MKHVKHGIRFRSYPVLIKQNSLSFRKWPLPVSDHSALTVWVVRRLREVRLCIFWERAQSSDESPGASDKWWECFEKITNAFKGKYKMSKKIPVNDWVEGRAIISYLYRWFKLVRMVTRDKKQEHVWLKKRFRATLSFQCLSQVK